MRQGSLNIQLTYSYFKWGTCSMKASKLFSWDLVNFLRTESFSSQILYFEDQGIHEEILWPTQKWYASQGYIMTSTYHPNIYLCTIAWIYSNSYYCIRELISSSQCFDNWFLPYSLIACHSVTSWPSMGREQLLHNFTVLFTVWWHRRVCASSPYLCLEKLQITSAYGIT